MKGEFLWIASTVYHYLVFLRGATDDGLELPVRMPVLGRDRHASDRPRFVAALGVLVLQTQVPCHDWEDHFPLPARGCKREKLDIR